jgi:hypothetical protein
VLEFLVNDLLLFSNLRILSLGLLFRVVKVLILGDLQLYELDLLLDLVLLLPQLFLLLNILTSLMQL